MKLESESATFAHLQVQQIRELEVLIVHHPVDKSQPLSTKV